MVKKRFIDKNNATTYRLVHRSQRDPLINDENAPKLVLQEVSTGRYLNEDYKDFGTQLTQISDEEEDQDFDEEADKIDWKKDVSNFGVFFKNQDEYDYLQHMKPFGQDPTAVVLTTNVETKKGIQFKDDQLKINMDRKDEIFGSKDELEVGLMNQEGVAGLNLDLDPEIRNAFVALDDDAYVEELDDDFFDAFHEEQIPDKYKLLQIEDLSDEEEEGEEWMKEFKKFQKKTDYEVTDDDFSDEQSEKIRIGRNKSSTNFSMSSSALFRNEKLTLLDDQFDKIMEEYSDEEIGAMDSDDEDLKGTYELSAIDGHLDEIFDSFLENLHVIGRKSRLVTRKPEESLDAIRTELKAQAKDALEKYEYVTPIMEMPIVMPGLKKKNDWDVETVLTTNSNIYNRPQLIKEISLGVPKIRLKRGVPVVLNEENSESDSETDSDEDIRGTKRNDEETKEEKKARKMAVKEDRRTRRETKKATKTAFGAEKGRQAKLAPNIKMQHHSVPL